MDFDLATKNAWICFWSYQVFKFQNENKKNFEYILWQPW